MSSPGRLPVFDDCAILDGAKHSVQIAELQETYVIALESVRFLVGSDGQPSAVQVELPVWQRILDALEDAEDVTLARAALAELAAAGGDPEKAGWLRVDDLAEAWGADDTE